MSINADRFDDNGNYFDPEFCPCCQGTDEYEPADLCDACIVAGLNGIYPHGCTHNDHCKHHREEHRKEP